MALTGATLPPGYVAPTYGTTSLAAVLPAVAGALGVELTSATGIESGAAAAALGLAATRRAVVVLVDGLGMHNLATRAGHAPFLRSMLPTARTLTTVYPSTTAAALGSFGTGTAPGRTAMAGYTQRNPATGGLANMVSWLGARAPRQVQLEEPLLGVMARTVPVTSVGPARFVGSGMTEAALSGGAYVPAESLADRVDVTLRVMKNPGMAYLYWGDVDKAGHHHGCGSAQWGEELELFDREFARLVRQVPRGTLVVLTADHGMVDVNPEHRRDVAYTPQLAAGVDLVGGEPRAVHVYTREPDAVATRWAGELGDDAFVWTRDQAISMGLFGPAVRDGVRPVFGDVVVAMRGRATVVDSRTQTPASMALVGMHGSLTEDEMTIPLLVAP